jgi:hypothetical protein
VLDLRAGFPAHELAQLNHLGIYSPPERLVGAIAERRGELERLGAQGRSDR